MGGGGVEPGNFLLSRFVLFISTYTHTHTHTYIYIYIYIYIYTKFSVDSLLPLLLKSCGRCILFFDVVEKKFLFSHTVSEIFVSFI